MLGVHVPQEYPLERPWFPSAVGFFSRRLWIGL